MIIYTKGTVKIVENPSIVEKFQLTEESAIEGFYCIDFLEKKNQKKIKKGFYHLQFYKESGKLTKINILSKKFQIKSLGWCQIFHH